MLKTIGIIGSGLVGKAVARLSIAAGYNVVISNSRGPHTLTEVVKDLGPRARAGSVKRPLRVEISSQFLFPFLCMISSRLKHLEIK